MQKGILQSSELFFYSGAFNPRLFFYPLSAGQFYCTREYRIDRSSFDSILIAYIVRGTFSFLYQGRELTAKAGEIALVNCFEPHMYCTHNHLETYWLHISGSNTKELFEELMVKRGCIISPASVIPAHICEFFELIKAREAISISRLSSRIYTLITGLFEETMDSEGENSLSFAAVRYMKAHYSEKITVEHMAKAVSLSPSQFSRQFKRQTGVPPYEYLLSLRLSKAKELLKTTELPVHEIAYQCGFGGESSFISFFKKQEGIPPLKFRTVLF